MHVRFSTKLRPWLIGMGISAALWLFLFSYADVYFSANDDQFLLRTFSGGSPGGAPTFHLYIHAMYAFPLSWLNQLFPGVAWVSILEITLMWLGTATIVKSLIQCCQRRQPLWQSLCIALCFVLLFIFYLCARPTYTTVAATLSAASVAQLLSVDCQNSSEGRLLRSMLYSLLLLVLCYGLRQMVSLPALCFCGLAFLYRMITCLKAGFKQQVRPLLAVILIVAVVMGSLAVAREAEITARGQREYLGWQQSRISVLDYITLENISAEGREAIGWSDAQVSLLDNWYTMEEAISTEAFTYVHENENNAHTRTTPGAAILDFRTLSPLIALSLIILFVIGIGCLLGLALRRKGLWTFLSLMTAAAGCLLLLAYLALQGRLPYRAVMVPVLPAAALVFCLIPECMPDKRWFRTAFLAVMIACTALYIIPTAQKVKYRESPWDYNTHAAMDEIALNNPDLLFIYSNELVNDMRMFPDFSNGIPANLMFWGGWQRGSPEYVARMEAFGLESEHFTPEDWLRPELRFLTLEEEPHPLLVRHLREKLGENLRWEQTKMDIALYAYRFYLE